MSMDNMHSRLSAPRKRPWYRRVSTFVICSLILSLCAALAFASLGGVPKAHAASWTQVWNDEFDGNAGTGVNTSNWLYDTGTGYGCSGCPGNWGTGEIENMTNSTQNVFLDGSGHLVIKATQNGGSWSSGRIETQRTDFAAPPGGELAVEASIQQPNVSGNAALGYWPAFWMLGSAFRNNFLNWPGIGEVDILEDINGLSSEFGTLHCGVSPGGPCNETTGLGSGQRACGGCQTGFHTYRVEIDRSVSPEQIRWFLDGNNFFTISANQVDPTTWANAVDHSFFIILDLAMGGGFPNGVCGCGSPTGSTASGFSMNVDYVRVFTSGGSGNNPPPPPPTPTPAPPSNGGCTSTFATGIDQTGASSALPWFQPCGWTAGYVILHYQVDNQAQQNVNMSFNANTSRWEFTIGGLNSGQTLVYSFTYQRDGLQSDTGAATFVFGSSGGTQPPPPTPVSCTGTFASGVNNTGSGSAQAWFQPCGWTAGYVILHYQVDNQAQQNVNMSFNANAGQWQLNISGISSGQVLTYSFTYQRDGLQNDTGTATWTHP